MNYLSIESEEDTKIKLLIEEYLIETDFKLNEDTIQRINTETNDNEETLKNVLNQVFVCNDFVNFLSDKYMHTMEINKIIQYSKIKFRNIERNEWWYSQNEWWFQSFDSYNSIVIPYISCWFVYSYALDNKEYIIEVLNNLYNAINAILK